MYKLSAYLICLICLIPSLGWTGEINLSVASSLKEAVTEVANVFTIRNPGVKIISNTGASGALAKQIENGAPADIFFSANVEWMDYLNGKGLINRTSIIVFAYNELVVAGRSGLKVTGMQDLTKLNRIAIGSPKSVPAGAYAMEAIKRSGTHQQLEKKLIMARDVRECLMYAERGEVDGAFVYRTDALLAAKKAKILFTVPKELYPRITYPMGLTVAGSRKAEATAFYKFLQSPDTQRILEKSGFATH